MTSDHATGPTTSGGGPGPLGRGPAGIEGLGALGLRDVMLRFRDALRSHQGRLNRLNVYPVPDGDTGTNMARTLDAVVEELHGAPPEMPATCTAISHGSLMGARGNSGVILSQILRGIADVLKEAEHASADAVARALRAASDAAYGAVLRPVEGTILTVVRAAATAAQEAVARGASLVHMLEEARHAGDRALASTPELLPQLKEAGVVDAGGAGFLLLLDAALHVVDGRPLPEGDEGADVAGGVAASVGHGEASHGPGAVDRNRYEVMFLLDVADDAAVEGFKARWDALGDSIVVVGGGGLWNCHVHTDDIGGAIEAGIEVGRPHRIQVTDLAGQVHDLQEQGWVSQALEPAGAGAGAAAVAGATAAEPVRERVAVGVVAVSVGAGVDALLTALGVQELVTGGQTMNPSTADLLAAVERCPADDVVVLPNNKNIVPVARQLSGLTAKRVHVVPTRSIPEALAALVGYAADGEGEAVAAVMEAAAAAVATGEVTQAVRASSSPAGAIAEGDWLGIARDGIVAVAPSLADAVTGLLGHLVSEDHELVTVLTGEGSSDDVTAAIGAWIAEHRPDAAVEVHEGGQPLYPYLLGAE